MYRRFRSEFRWLCAIVCALTSSALVALSEPVEAIDKTESSIKRVTVDDLRELRRLDDRGGASFRPIVVATVMRFDSRDAPQLILDTFHFFGDIQFSDGSSDKTLPAVERMLALAIAVKDEFRIAQYEALAGRMQYSIDRAAAARARVESGISTLRRLGKTRELAAELSIFALLLPSTNEFALATRYVNEAARLVALEPEPLSSTVFTVLYSQAEIHRMVGDQDATSRLVTSLLARAERSGNSEFIAFAQHSLARSLRADGDTVRAKALIEQSFQRTTEVGNRWARFIDILFLLEIAREDGSTKDARRWVNAGVSDRDAIDDPLARGVFDLEMASVLASEGKPTPARAALQRAKNEMGGFATHPYLASVEMTEGDVLASEGKYLKALEAMKKGVALRRKQVHTAERKILAAQAEVHQVAERELRESKLAQDARVSDLKLEAAEQSLLNQKLAATVAVLATVIAGMLAAWQVLRARKFRRQADVDVLTGILSRSAMVGAATAAFSRARRDDRPLALLLLDLDRLKWINDSFGHARGDEALKTLARCANESLRKGDYLGRWGGDEFVILLANTTASSAAFIKDRVQQAVREGLRNAGFLTGSCSAGLALIAAGDVRFEDMLERADAELYAAKATAKQSAAQPIERRIAVAS